MADMEDQALLMPALWNSDCGIQGGNAKADACGLLRGASCSGESKPWRILRGELLNESHGLTQ